MFTSSIALLTVSASMLQVPPLSYNMDILQSWQDSLQEAQSTGSVVNNAVIGDSIVMNRFTWTYWIRNHLFDLYGNAGQGTLDVHSSSNGDDSGSYVWSPVFVTPWGQNSAWTRHYDDTEPTHVMFPTGVWVTCEHSNGGWRMTFEGSQARLRYIEEAGAGSMTIKIDGNLVATLNADNGSAPASVTYDIPLPGYGVYTMELESTAPPSDPQPVRIDSLDVRTENPGSVVHRWGQIGKPISQFLENSEQMYQDLFTKAAVDVLWIQCDPTYEGNEQYEIDLRAFVARMQNIRPGMPIVLISHHHFGDHRRVSTDIMYQISTDTPGVAFINLFDLHASKDDLLTLDYLLDDVHLNNNGGQFFAAWILREMLGWSRADLDLDGQVGQSDLGLLLSSYDLSIGDEFYIDLADIDRDGHVGQEDLGLLLADYGWVTP